MAPFPFADASASSRALAARLAAVVAVFACVAQVGAGVASGQSVPLLTDYRIVQWTTADGLPQNTVNDIVLLPNGELWVATFGGLARFDGHEFHVVDMATD